MISRRMERPLFMGLSFLLALLLWFHVVGQKESEWSFSVPVHVRLAEDNADMAARPEPSRVSVLLKGPRRLMDELQEGKAIYVRLDIAERDPGEYVRSIAMDMVAGVPRGIEIERIEPSEVAVELKQKFARQLRVVPRLRIGLPAGMMLKGAAVADPAFVSVRGIPSRLEGVTEAVTEEMEMEGKPGAGTARMKIAAPPEVTVFPPYVNVRWEVVPTASEIAPDSPPSAPPAHLLPAILP